MTKTLKVIEPFFDLEVGDTFELSQDGKSYNYEVNENSGEASASGEYKSSFSARFTISKEYAQELVKSGVLEEVKYGNNEEFKNVFTEIDTMINKYGDELTSLDKDFANQPACLKLEKETVLKNLIKVLSHLRGLKK